MTNIIIPYFTGEEIEAYRDNTVRPHSRWLLLVMLSIITLLCFSQVHGSTGKKDTSCQTKLRYLPTQPVESFKCSCPKGYHRIAYLYSQNFLLRYSIYVLSQHWII